MFSHTHTLTGWQVTSLCKWMSNNIFIIDKGQLHLIKWVQIILPLGKQYLVLVELDEKAVWHHERWRPTRWMMTHPWGRCWGGIASYRTTARFPKLWTQLSCFCKTGWHCIPAHCTPEIQQGSGRNKDRETTATGEWVLSLDLFLLVRA